VTRFYCDEAGGVYERASGRYLGRVDAVELRPGEALYWPLDLRGNECGRVSLIKARAVLAVIRASRGGVSVSLRDVEGPGV
jgi:hypothetical protein